MITIAYRPDFEMHYRASRQIFHQTLASKFFYGVFIGLPLLVLMGTLFQGLSPFALAFGFIPIWLVVLLMLMYPLVVLPMVQRHNLKRAFESNTRATMMQNFEFSAEGVRNFGKGFNVSLPWDRIARIVSAKGFLLLFISASQAYYIPLEQIAVADRDALQGWWQEGRQRKDEMTTKDEGEEENL